MRRGPEGDVPGDPHVAGSRATGGRRPDDERDKHSTTGTSRNETYVGRVAGDEADAEETGAEARAAGGDRDTPSQD